MTVLLWCSLASNVLALIGGVWYLLWGPDPKDREDLRINMRSGAFWVLLAGAGAVGVAMALWGGP